MASPPMTGSPTAISPPYPSPAQLPNKKRSSTFDGHGQQIKRRKASIASQSSGLAHPLRQTSFPPEARSPFVRSPSVDTMSHVSGSAVSEAASGVTKGKKKSKSKSKKKGDGSKEATPSTAGGKAGTSVVGQGGDKDAEEEEDDDKAEMAVEDVVARTQEQKQEEIRLRAMLVEAFDPEQYDRYELWRAAKLSEAVVKRVVNATVSQSVPQMVSTAVKAVAKIFAGELIEQARDIQAEWIYSGEEQVKPAEPPHEGDEEKLPTDEEKRDERARALIEQEKQEGKKPRSGPLRPDHLREAWRRYKLTSEARGVGMQQLWQAQQHTGVERFSTRTRKRMFK